MTLLPHLWLGSNYPPAPNSIQKFTTVVLQAEGARRRDSVTYFVNQTLHFSIMLDYHSHFLFLHGAQCYNTHESYASALQMLVTLLYWLIRDGVCWKERAADSHWALLWNTGEKGSLSSHFTLKTGQPTGRNVPGSGFGDMKVHIDVPSLVLLSWDCAQMQTLPPPPAISTPFCYGAFHGLWGLPGQPRWPEEMAVPQQHAVFALLGKTVEREEANPFPI